MYVVLLIVNLILIICLIYIFCINVCIIVNKLFCKFGLIVYFYCKSLLLFILKKKKLMFNKFLYM